MKSFDIVGYAYEAALHCPDCTEKRFGEVTDETEDGEGNVLSPVFAGDEPGDSGDYCDDCGEPLDNMSPEIELDVFIRNNKQDMLADLVELLKTIKPLIETIPIYETDTTSCDIRLCIDIKTGDHSWIFRTGDSSYDQQHSMYCAASSIGQDTQAGNLLDDLLNQF